MENFSKRAFPKFSLRIKYTHKLYICIYIYIYIYTYICLYDMVVEKVTKNRREN